MVRFRRRSQPPSGPPPEPPPPPSGGSPDEVSIEEEMTREAADFVARWATSGSPVPAAALDYSRASLAVVDAMLGDCFSRGAELPGGLHFLTSAYVCEVVRRTFDGRYLLGPDDDNPLVVVVGEPACRVGVMVFGKVTGRVVNGPEDDLGFFFDGIAPAVARGVDATIV